MRHALMPKLAAIRYAVMIALTGPQALAFLPALVLGGFWLGGEQALLITALAVPLLLAAVTRTDVRDPATPGDGLDATLDAALRTARNYGRRTGCFLIGIDAFDELLSRHGHIAADRVMTCAADRVRAALRNDDTTMKLGPGQIGVVIAPVRQMDTGIALQLAARLQAALAEPVALDRTTVYITVSIGFCLDALLPGGTGKGVADAAGMALCDARRHGPAGTRAYTPDLPQRAPPAQDDHEELRRALGDRQIRAWFQPQICTDTGAISGFEALARWEHPTQGTLPPDEFLPRIEALGLSETLGRIILQDALLALQVWSRAGFHIPRVGVNFAADELRDPKLPDRVAWEIDRVGLTPDRITVEILESVVASTPDDTVTRNIRRLSDMGCLIDLDDFGTGHASICSIRRFAVQRLKIDRSFVTRIDRDPEQQRMVNAIQLMAEQLNLATLAEGVETSAEHAMLAQLGCGSVQGFGIARPMPLDETVPWIAAHHATLKQAPAIGRKHG